MIIRCYRLGSSRQKRAAVLVEETVHQEAQGVGVHIGAVGVTSKKLRRHGGGGCAPDLSAYGEIPQLVAVTGNENISGFDVIMDDVVTVEDFQSLADMRAELNYVKRGERCCSDMSGKGKEEFHADQDLEGGSGSGRWEVRGGMWGASLTSCIYDHVVHDAHNMVFAGVRRLADLLHQSYFRGDVGGDSSIEFVNGFLVKSFVLQELYF